MKKARHIMLFIMLMIMYGLHTYAQKIMMLNDSLKNNSQALEAKRKGVSALGKYEFGVYKIVSGKAGWTTSKSPISFLTLEKKSTSKQKSSFVLVGNDKDSVVVNTATNTKKSEFGWEDLSFVNESNENYTVLIAPSNGDTTKWKMYVSTKSGDIVFGKTNANGILTDGTTQIEIKQVNQWSDGKTPTLSLIIGFEFYRNQQSIAAVQASKDSFQKKYVWMHQNVEDHIKLVLAAAAAALLIQSDNNGMD